MTDERLLGQPDVAFDFNLPHGIDAEEDEAQTAQAIAVYTNEQDDKQDFDYRQFSPGFSDDEGSGEAFERSSPTHQAKKQAAKAFNGKKLPRRSDNESGDSGSSARGKKPRLLSFGGADQRMSDEEHADNFFAPATSAHGIGHRMSDLNLDQQYNGEHNVQRPMNTGFGLACSDIGSFRDSSVPSDDEFVIPPDTVPHYELRRNIDRKKAVTHVDNDKSGNWDPEQEAKGRVVKLVHAKAAKKQKKEKRKKNGKNMVIKDYTMKCIVKLPFDAFGNVRNITNDEQNWPDHWSDIDSEQERELEEHQGAYRTNTPDCELQLPLEDPAGEVDDLTGYPAARGCKQCRKLQKPCLMAKGGNYPCKKCVEEGSECQPIQEPTVKGRCKQCDQANEELCSFENDPMRPICDYCADKDHICEALPPDGYRASRVNIEEIIWGPDRLYTACTHCRIMKRRCSLKRKEDNPPCKNCTEENLGCTFYRLPKQDSEKKIANKESLIKRIAPEVAKANSGFFTEEDLAEMDRRNTEVLEREATPNLEMEDGEGNNGMLTKITTSFAHPILFLVKRVALSDCHFCEIPIFGMVGYFEKEVHVIRWHNGRGYAEVGGGHCQDAGETKMCTECTHRRLQIIICPGHKFERMVDATIDHSTLTEELTEAETGGADMQYQIQRWCSLCFSPASLGCNTVQPDLLGEDQAEIAGCHLRLCVACEKTLRDDYGGDFNEMVTNMDSKPKINEADEVLGKRIEGRPRADVGLLKQNGLLYSTIMAMED